MIPEVAWNRPAWSRFAGIQHDLRPYWDAVGMVDAISLAAAPDADLASRAANLRRRAGAGEPLDALLPETLAVARQGAARVLGLRPFDVQVAAAVALHRLRLVEMATGEGKTLVVAMAAALGALEGRGLHVFTANDYLAGRDAAWMAPLYRLFGLEVSAVTQGMGPSERRRAYAADVTYVTAKEAGFDFLRDELADSNDALVQRPRHAVIVDEADFLLVDEARVPLVIAGPGPRPEVNPVALAGIVRGLEPGTDFDTDDYARTVALTETGLQRLSSRLGVAALHDPASRTLSAAVHVALHAEVLLQRDRDYIVRNGRVELVDAWTGRVAPNRRWPHGIQAAVEAKEGLEIQPDGTVLGSIPVQHFVRLYPKVAGTTATAVSAAEEFAEFYGLTTVVVPPHRRCRRIDEPDVVFTHAAAKLAAVAEEVARAHASGRPVLVGTVSVRESEDLARTLRRHGIRCHVLNARHDAREARIVARAGAPGAVTIATNMAGRGTDVVLGGPDGAARDAVAALGGLYVIGTNRHESRRIDDQLRGRAGRQGDPGTSRFFVSLEDDLIRRYGVLSLIPHRHRPAPSMRPVASPVVRREIARAQRIVEGQNFEIRRTLWQYSWLIEQQRRVVHAWRTSLRDGTAEPLCALRAPARHAALCAAVGEDAVRHAERVLTARMLQRGWADHLGVLEDIREGIHLQRYGGREPIAEFHREAVGAFDAMLARVRDDTVAAFTRLGPEEGVLDPSGAGAPGSSATWTYVIDDNPFSTLGVSLMASRNLGVSAGAGVLAVVHWPVSVAVAATVFLRRWLARRRLNPPR